MSAACRRPSSRFSTGPPLHGATGTPVCSARTFASILAPRSRIAAGGGPTKTTPREAHSSANAGSSATKPHPTHAASARAARSARASSAWSRYGFPSPVSRSSTASSAARTNVARRSASVCRATTRVPDPCSALSSRTARISRMAGSPRLITAMRSNNAAPLPVAVATSTAEWWRGLHVQPAVDAPDLTGDVGGGVGRQEVHDAGDLLRFPEPAERDLRPQPVQDLLRNAVEHLGRGVAGGDGVDGHPEPVGLPGPLQLHRGLAGERFGEPEQPRLGRRVVDLADAAGLADHR